jgi:hypothetical protein
VYSLNLFLRKLQLFADGNSKLCDAALMAGGIRIAHFDNSGKRRDGIEQVGSQLFLAFL